MFEIYELFFLLFWIFIIIVFSRIGNLLIAEQNKSVFVIVRYTRYGKYSEVMAVLTNEQEANVMLKYNSTEGLNGKYEWFIITKIKVDDNTNLGKYIEERK